MFFVTEEKKIEDQKIDTNSINNSLWVQEKSQALMLYSEMIHNIQFSEKECKSNLSFERIKDILNILMAKYNYFEETLWAILLFFKYVAHNYVDDLLFVYHVFNQFMKYFYGGKYRTYVVQQITNYLINVNTDASDYLEFCDYVLFYFPYSNFPNKDQYEKTLLAKRDYSLLKKIDNMFYSGQTVFAIKNCLKIYHENKSLNIKQACLKRLIKIYTFLKIPLLVEKYYFMLKNLS